VEVTVLGDDIWEGNETLLLRLTNSINGSIADDLGVGTIIEDEPVPTVSISDAAVTEGNSGTTNMAFTVTLSAPTQLFFPYRVDNLGGMAVAGADFSFSSLPLNIGGNVLTYTFNVPVFGETYTEPDETFTLRLVRTQGGPTVADEIGVGTILNDDPTSGTMTFPAQVWGQAQDLGADGIWDSVFPGGSSPSNDVRKSAGEVEYRTLFEFDVSRVIEGEVTHALFSFSIPPTGFTAWFGTCNVVGYAGNGLLDLADANVAGPTLAGFGDPNQTGRRTVVLNRDQVLALTAGSDWLGLRIQASSATANVPIRNPLIGPANAPVVTFRTDTAVVPTISVNDVSAVEGNSEIRFTVTLSAPTILPVTVRFTLANGTATAGSDYFVPTILTVYFEPGETSKQVGIFVQNDSLVEPDETLFMNLSDPENATILDGTGLGTILNDD
jgi:Calx-beta domain